MHIQTASVNFQSQYQLQRQHSSRAISPPALTKSNSTSVHQNTSVPQMASVLPGSADPALMSIKRILETFLGREISLTVATENLELASSRRSGIEQSTGSVSNTVSLHGSRVQNTQATTQVPPPEQQWLNLSISEQEQRQFSISAQITLANGEERSVAIEETMARSLSLELQVTAIEAAQIIDPLVINFGGPVKLSDQRVEFDLNADGSKDSIASFASKSACIAWDRNKDGTINDGSELFGALTGDGFAELAVFDDDGNGFIDQHDAIYSQLQLFDPNRTTSRSLNASGVEAIYLDNISTPFTLTGKTGDTLGIARSTSFYLTEKGAGTVQQIDLVV